MQCKSILERHEILDVHCEMKEAPVYLATSAPDTPDHPQLRYPRVRLGEEGVIGAEVAVSDFVGGPIASFDRPQSAGTKGLYLRRNEGNASDDTVFALTCRHVVFGVAEDDGTEFVHNATNPEMRIVQPDDSTFHEHIKDLEYKLRSLTETLGMVDQFTETVKILFIETIRERMQQQLDRMRSFEAREARVIGHVVVAPSPRRLRAAPEPGSAKADCGDWALIELRPEKHEGNLASITNNVWVGHFPDSQLEAALHQAPAFPAPERETFYDGLQLKTLQLKGMIPIEELYNPPQCNAEGDPVILVAKVGSASGLTFGFTSTCKSVRRQVINGEVTLTDVWCILSCRKEPHRLGKRSREPFSANGDSGACVFDLKGRVCGMITSGCGLDVVHDTTYVMPIEGILDEMREHGFDLTIA